MIVDGFVAILRLCCASNSDSTSLQNQQQQAANKYPIQANVEKKREPAATAPESNAQLSNVPAGLPHLPSTPNQQHDAGRAFQNRFGGGLGATTLNEREDDLLREHVDILQQIANARLEAFSARDNDIKKQRRASPSSSPDVDRLPAPKRKFKTDPVRKKYRASTPRPKTDPIEKTRRSNANVKNPKGNREKIDAKFKLKPEQRLQQKRSTEPKRYKPPVGYVRPVSPKNVPKRPIERVKPKGANIPDQKPQDPKKLDDAK